METLDLTAAAPLIAGHRTVRFLGAGATSTVWLVRRESDGMRLAVKCPKSGDGAAPTGSASSTEQAVSREVEMLTRLRHEHLLRVHGTVSLGESGGCVGTAMEYAAGGSLATLVAGRQRLGTGETVTVLTAVARALDYLHSQGAVHGDVSPGNVLLTAAGMPLLSDFGNAMRVGDSALSEDVGTEGFVDPSFAERGHLESAVELRPHRDVYSLGALGWYCLTGQAPQQLKNRPPLTLMAPDTPPALAAALEAALDQDPHERPTAREFAHAVFRSKAPEVLDLAGTVHPSVIPELLTRRQALGRNKARSTPWLRPVRLRPVRLRPVRLRPGALKPLAVAATVVVAALSASALLGGFLPGPATHAVARQGDDREHGGVAGTVLTAKLPDVLAGNLTSHDPLVALQALSAVRDAALSEGQLQWLSLVNVPGSPAEATDDGIEKSLRQSGTVLAGLKTTLTSLKAGTAGQSDHAMIEATAITSGYEEREQSGKPVSTQAEAAPQHLLLHLVWQDGLWRVFEILEPVG
ncbi:serine/threonine-protein kinase [Paenarthrobacter ilicis]|uniref:serine/threonine protein kinase n=1 Tax=Paenarthrobacter ilicis TaxID=43665 RepID=UPI0028D724D2|nr:serine/threonine-protein kinase [Paenarthrobacter ilicis]